MGHGPVLVVYYLITDGIKPNNGIHRIKGVVLPALYLGRDTVGDAADGLGGYAVTELLLLDVAYLTRAVTDGIQAYDAIR